MHKLNDNFYTITRRRNNWSKKQRALLRSVVNYKMFNPIPREFVHEAIFGTKDEDGDLTQEGFSDFVQQYTQPSFDDMLRDDDEIEDSFNWDKLL